MQTYAKPRLKITYSIQRSAFDRHASLSQPGGTFSIASGPNLTLLNEDSKRLGNFEYKKQQATLLCCPRYPVCTDSTLFCTEPSTLCLHPCDVHPQYHSLLPVLMLSVMRNGQTWSTATWGSEGPSVLSLQSTLPFGELLVPRSEVWSAAPAWFLDVLQPPSPTGPVLLQNCNDDSLNVALPMRMLEVFSSENTYLPVLQDASYVVSVIEQILHYMIQNGYYRSLYLLINSKLPSSIEYSDLSRVPIAKILLENVLKPLHFTYNSCPEGARQQVFTAFTKEVLAAPFTEQVFHFVIPALADVQTVFPYEPFLNALLSIEGPRSKTSGGAPWLFYFVLTVGENYLGTLSEEGLLVYLRVLQTLLSQLPVSPANTSCQDSASDSEDESGETDTQTSAPEDGRLSVPYITEECLKKLDTKQQTNTLLNLVWRDSASEEAFTLMAAICHTLMVQHRVMASLQFSLQCQVSETPLVSHIFYDNTDDHRVYGTIASDSSRIIPLFYLFSSLFSHSLISIHDNEFFGDPIDVVGQRQSSMMPFTLEELIMLSRCLRDACLGIIKLAYPETKPEVREEYIIAFQSIGVTTNSEMQRCIQMEQKRWVQLFKFEKLLRKVIFILHLPPFKALFLHCLHVSFINCPKKRSYELPWLECWQETTTTENRTTGVEKKKRKRVITNLVKMLKSRDARRNFCPPNHWLSEQEDIKADKIFQRLIYADKQEVQGDGPFLDGINVTIRRNYIYEDAYDKLSPENEPDLKKRIRVHLLNAHGLDEAGIDGGGIFREFLNELLKSGFNPNQGFFKTTNEGLLYPNPAAQMLVGESFARHYYFLGRMLGKLLLLIISVKSFTGMSFPCCLWLLSPGAELSSAEVCAAGPFPGHVCQPCCGTRRQPDHKGPVCPMMKSWLFILWVVQNHCVQQMAEVTDLVHF
eukprot:bmy_12875T0